MIARQFNISGLSEQQVQQNTTHLIVKPTAYVAEPHLKKFIDDGWLENGKANHPYFQSTQKFEAMQHQTTAIKEMAYPVPGFQGTLIFPKPLASKYTGDLLLYRMALEGNNTTDKNTLFKWDEEREAGRRHYRVRKDDMLTVQRAHDETIIRTPDTRSIYWVTQDMGFKQRKVVYIGTVPLFLDPLDSQMMTQYKEHHGIKTNSKPKYVRVGNKTVRQDKLEQIYRDHFKDEE